MVSSVRLAVVTNQLEPADHLADGEEAQALGQEHAASHHLCPRQVAGLLGVDGLQEVGEEDAGGLQLLPQVLEVGLEGRDGTVEGGQEATRQQRAPKRRVKQGMMRMM